MCDIIEDRFSNISPNGGINSVAHSIGKIGDSDSVFTNFDSAEINEKLLKYKHTDAIIGTHCWPGKLDCSLVDEVISITTETSKSKIYRWIRAWHLYFSKLDDVKNLTGMALIDKQRELAKNYLPPFCVVQGITNIEFADIVETTQEFFSFLKDCPTDDHLKRWQEVNYFLYDKNLWNNELVQRYYEAEFEMAHGRFYKYY